MRAIWSAFCAVTAWCMAILLSTAAPAAEGLDLPALFSEGMFFDLPGSALRALPAPPLRVAKDAGPVALGLSKFPEFGPRTGSEPTLPWILTPSFPPILPTTAPKRSRAEAKLPVLEDARMLALERAVDRRSPTSVRHVHIFERHKRQSEGRLPPISRLSPQQMSSLWTDPLAALAFEGDAAAQAPEFIMPFANGRVTSLFNQGRRHPAIDLAGALGSPVLATTGAQKVVFAGWRGGYGNAVITQDMFGWTHLYGHLASIASRVGQMLEQGDKLGHLGSTGHSTGPHVHYEVRDSRGAHVNPVGLLFPGRSVGKGLAWAGVGQFAASPQLASRTVSRERIASAGEVAAGAGAIKPTPPSYSAKRQGQPSKRKPVRYAYRVRRAASEDDD